MRDARCLMQRPHARPVAGTRRQAEIHPFRFSPTSTHSIKTEHRDAIRRLHLPLSRRVVDVRARLLARDEIALIDVREEDPYAQGHPLWAANFPLSKLDRRVDADSAPRYADRRVRRSRRRGSRAARGRQARAARLHRRAAARRRPRGLARRGRRTVHRRERAEQVVRRMGRGRAAYAVVVRARGAGVDRREGRCRDRRRAPFRRIPDDEHPDVDERAGRGARAARARSRRTRRRR